MANTLIGDFAIDCMVRVAPEYSGEITRFPVARGSVASDHRIVKPNMLQLEGIVSDYPVADMIEKRAAQFAGANGQVVFSKAADDFFKNLNLKSTILTITTERGVWENMMLERYTPTFEAGTENILRWTATFAEVQFVDVARVTVKVAVPSVSSGKKKTSAPPVIFNANDADGFLITNSGRRAKLSDKGVYEYVDKSGKSTGVPVSNDDFDTTSGVITEDEVNSTYFDFERDEWVNTDGSPVTRQDLSKAKSVPSTAEKEEEKETGVPWYKKDFDNRFPNRDVVFVRPTENFPL